MDSVPASVAELRSESCRPLSWGSCRLSRDPGHVKFRWRFRDFGDRLLEVTEKSFPKVGRQSSQCWSGVARGLLQGRPLQLPMGWGVGDELTKSWPTFEQLCVQNLALAISYCFSHTKSAYKIRLARIGERLRGNTVRGNRTESLWEGNMPLRGLWEDLWEGGFQRFSEGFQRSSQRPSQRQISLSGALGPVAPIPVAPQSFSNRSWPRVGQQSTPKVEVRGLLSACIVGSLWGVATVPTVATVGCCFAPTFLSVNNSCVLVLRDLGKAD